MDQSVRSEIVGTAGLTLAACGALLLTWLRTPRLAVSRSDAARRSSSAWLCSFTPCTSPRSTRRAFYARYPPLLGLAPWSPDFFLIVNLCWLGIWVCAAFGLRA